MLLEMKTMSKILLFWKSISIFIFIYRFKNKDNFIDSLQKFIHKIQVDINNYLVNSPPSSTRDYTTKPILRSFTIR
jgi:hypothetical protein